MQSQLHGETNMESNQNCHSLLTQSQIQLCTLAQQFSIACNPKVQQKLIQSNWLDMVQIIKSPKVDNKIRIICCSALKVLVYHKKFINNNAIGLFNHLSEFYISTQVSGQTGKMADIIQIVLQAIPSAYMKQKDKECIITQLLSLLNKAPNKSIRILKLCKIIIESIQAIHLNNQVITGQLLLFLQKALQQNNSKQFKLTLSKQIISLFQLIIDVVNDQDETESNIVEQFLYRSTLAKGLVTQIIADGSEGKQIIMQDELVNQVKIVALQFYTSIWVYYADQQMFKLCLATLLTRPQVLVDQMQQIMIKVVCILQRSISQEAYYTILHSNIQNIVLSLLDLLNPKQSMIALCRQQPNQYVEMLYDFCMEQQNDMLETKIGSLISSLCMYIDGYMSFIGSLCILMIKQFNGSIKSMPQTAQYMKSINNIWKANTEHKTAVCILVLCAISDQLDKRQDLQKPLRVQMMQMTKIFQLPCQIPSYLISRFMLLYSFMAYPKSLDPFLPFILLQSVYPIAMQSCFKVMSRYFSKFPQFVPYISSIAPVILLSTDYLTPLLQSVITTGQIIQILQYKILQKLILWMQEGLIKNNRQIGNKMANLIKILIQRIKIQDYGKQQQSVYAYIQPLVKAMNKKQNSQYQQFVIEICVAYVAKFPNIKQNQQRISNLLKVGFYIVQRNNGILNNCLDLFFQLTTHLSCQLVHSLAQIYIVCLNSQTQIRQQDHWQCYYGLQVCMIRIGQLNGPVPSINLNWILNMTKQYKSKTLKCKALMFIFSMLLANTNNHNKFKQLFNEQLMSIKPPIYQNKPYLLYLFFLAPYLPIDNEQTAEQLFSRMLEYLRRQRNYKNEIVTYEDQIYCKNIMQSNQVENTAYAISRKLMHPLIMKNYDIYNQFRKFLQKFAYKNYIISKLKQEDRSLVLTLCNQVTINNKVRKINRVNKNLQTYANQPVLDNSKGQDLAML